MLVVGDRPRDTECLCDMLPRSDWEVVQCRSAAEAAQFAGETGCAIIVCDKDECEGSWVEVLDGTRQLQEPPVLVVVANHADERLWSEVLNKGGYDVLQKPLDRAEVTRVMGMAWRYKCSGRRVM